jgi:hypothetical protein
MKKNNHIWLLIVIMLILQTECLCANQNQIKLGTSDESFNKIFEQGKIINEGQMYLRTLQFQNALAKYDEALAPEHLVSNDDRYYPLALKVNCLQYLGKYEEALSENKWYLSQKDVRDTQIDRDIKLTALVKWQDVGDSEDIYKYIDYAKQKHSKYYISLPPSVFTDIAELYDLIGDYDAGIAWAKAFKKTAKSKRYKREYDNVIKAFEESKQGMPQICGDEGRACVGRATAYIIQSDRL